MSESSDSTEAVSRKGVRRTPWWRSSIAAIAVVLALFGSYFFLHVEARHEELDKVHLRFLANAAEGIEQAVEGVQSQLDKAIESIVLSEPGAEAPSTDDGEPEGAAGLPRAVQELHRRLEPIVGLTWKGSAETVVGREWKVEAHNPASQVLSFTFEEQDRRAFATFGLEEHLKPYMATDLFEYVLLVKDEKVLLQFGTAPLSFTECPNLGSADADGSGQAPGLEGGTQLHTVVLADQAFRLYEQRFEVALRELSGSSRSEVWRVVGLLPQAELSRQAMRASPNLILLVLAMVVILVLSMPIVRLLGLGERSPVRVRDVSTLGMSLLALVGFCSLILEDASRIRSVRSLRDGRQLVELSKSMRSSIADELDRMDRQLALMTERCLQPLPLDAGGVDVPWDRSKVLLQEGSGRTWASTDPYLAFEKAFWLNSEGTQIAKWTIRHPTARVSVPDRPYFKELVEGRPQPAVARGPFQAGRYVQSIRSRTDGRESLVLSRRRAPDQKPEFEVAAIEAEASSLYGAALPHGFHFAVVQEDGTVLFHSDPERNLIENAFREFDPHGAIEAAVQTRSGASLEASYLGHDYSVRVDPMDGLPWSLIAFASLDPIRAHHVEVLGFTLSLFAVHFLLVLLLVLSVWHLRTPGKPRGGVARFWFWPNPQHVEKGLRWLVIASVLGGYLLFVDDLSSSGRILRMAALAFFVLSTLEQLFDWKARKTSRETLSHCWPPSKAVSLLRQRLKSDPGMSTVLILAGVLWLTTLVSLAAGFVSIPLLGFAAVLLFLARNALLSHFAALSVFVFSGIAEGEWVGAALCSVLASLITWGPSKPWEALAAWVQEHQGHRQPWVYLYNLSVVAVAGLLGAIPILSYYNGLVEEGLRVHARLQQDGFAKAISDRSERMASRYAGVETSPEAQDALEAFLFPVEPKAARGVFPDVWLDLDASHDAIDDKGRHPAPLSAFLGRELPAFSTTSPLLRQTAKQGWNPTGEPVFAMSASGDALQSRHLWRYRSPWAPGGRVEEPVTLTMNLGQPGEGSWLRQLILVTGAFAAFYAVVSALTQRLFLVGRFGAGQRAAVGLEHMDAGGHLLLVGELPRDSDRDEHGYRLTLAPWALEQLTAEEIVDSVRGHEDVLVEGLDLCIQAGVSTATLLEALETLLALEKGPRVVLHAIVDPLHLLTVKGQGLTVKGQGESGGAKHSLARWSRLLESFHKVRFPFQLTPLQLQAWKAEMELEAPDVRPEVRAAILKECAPTRRLRDLAAPMLRGERLDTLGPRLIPERILDAHEPYYRSLWELCNQEEKLVLYRLARQGFVNWKQKSALQRLIRRGLVIKRPFFALMNESFRQFVLNAEPKSRIEAWEAAGESGHLESLRGPLLFALLILGAFLFTTQQDTFNQALAVVTALATGAPLLIRLMGMTGSGAWANASNG